MEQYRLDFGPEKKPENNVKEKEPALESLGFENLQMLYQEKVGIDPKYRNLNRGELISGIQDPEAEKERLAKEDKESDRDDLTSPYKGKK
jgi:hypothetical protein